MSTYGATPSFAQTYPNLDAMLAAIPDNNAHVINADELRNSVYTLWTKIEEAEQALTNGPQGAQGLTGPQGPQGLRGVQGYTGFQGGLGLQGVIGNDGANTTRWVYGNSNNLLEFSSNFTTWQDDVFVFNGNGPVTGTNAWFQSLKDWIDSGNTAMIQFTEAATYKTAIYNINTIAFTSNKWIIDSTIIYTPSVNTIITSETYSVSWILNGPIGIQGPVGVQGVVGNIGVQGRQGPVGVQGIIGDLGPQGADGIQGLKGDRGYQGFQGINGTQGTQGAQGKIRENYIVSTLSQYQGNQRLGLYNPQTNKFNWVALEGMGTSGDGYPSNSGGYYKITLYINGFASYTDSNFLPSNYGDYSFDATSYGALSHIDCYLIVEGGGAIVPTRLNTTYQGVTGVQGLQGIQGIQGGIGMQGAAGPQGINGSVGFQGIIGTTGDQGPLGYQGYTGPVGTQGYQGPNGDQGVQGTGGSQGAFGPQGFTGFQGPSLLETGAQGPEGDTGVQGIVGPQGAIGNQGRQGWQGINGPQGLKGDQGYQGLAGSGAQGATGIQGAQGPIGNQGAQGRQGYQGIGGVQGVQGIGGDGNQGATGPQGSGGPVGVQGWQGIGGTNGQQGYQGRQGSQGLSGVQGNSGPSGTQGYQGTGPQGSQGLGVQGPIGLQGALGPQGAQSTYNIYDNNGTVVSNRTVNGGFYSIIFTNFSKIDMRTDEFKIINDTIGSSVKLDTVNLSGNKVQEFQNIDGSIEVLPTGTPTLSTPTTNASVSTGGILTNKFGQINVTLGGASTVNVTVVLTFTTPYPNGSILVLSPYSAGISKSYYVSVNNASESQFVIESMTAGQTLRFNYVVNGY